MSFFLTTPPADADAFEISKVMQTMRFETIPLDKVILMPNYPSYKYEEPQFIDMIENVRFNGVMAPITVRIKDGAYEILSGMNRAECARAAGMTKICALIVDCPDDRVAIRIALEYNVAQRGIDNLKISQKARVIGDYYNGLKVQGFRKDLTRRASKGGRELNVELFQLNKRGFKKKSKSSGGLGQKDKADKIDTREEVASAFNLSGRNMARLLRINDLIDPLKERADNEDICFTVAVQLSFLTEREQEYVEEALAAGAKINVKKGGKLRAMSRKNSFAPTRMVNRINVKRVLFDLKLDKEPAEETQTAEEAPEETPQETPNTQTFNATADAEIPAPYARIPNMMEYLKETYPAYFDVNTDGATEHETFVRRLIHFFVTISDAMRFYFPKYFKPVEDYCDVLKRLYDAIWLYYLSIAKGELVTD
jgi:ParB-like chromosome segregation protein Spo0J